MRKAEITLTYNNYIERAPVAPQQLYAQSCSNDDITIESWRPTWIKNITENHKRFGPFKDKSIGKLFGSEQYKPVIVAGSGPSLKVNGAGLKDKKDICLISCLHNFHFMEDNGIDVDYYVTLDAGDVTIEEVYEGGTKTPDEYWALTKERTLLAYIGSSPRLLEKWQGQILFFNAPIPDKQVTEAIEALENFHIYISNGGNVLGACVYIAKSILGANPIAFMGADFSFSYDKKFHAWDSKYDAHLGNVIKTYDVYGMPVLTWNSYHNFKGWFDWLASTVPGIYINCSEGGTFGAYLEGNIMSVVQKPLLDFFEMYHLNLNIKDSCENPEGLKDENGKVIKKLLF